MKKPDSKDSGFFIACKEKEMAKKRIEIDGIFYRKRRNKLVEIPEEWVGKTTHPQTIRKRPSKKGQGRKFKKN